MLKIESIFNLFVGRYKYYKLSRRESFKNLSEVEKRIALLKCYGLYVSVISK